MAVEGAERASSSNPEKPKKSSGNGHGNGSTPQAERICAKPGCGAVLGERNRSGFCQNHFHHSEKQNRNRKKGSEQKVHRSLTQVRASAAPSTPSSGNGVELTLDRGDLKSDRLDHLFLSLPITEKERIACAWLTGKI